MPPPENTNFFYIPLAKKFHFLTNKRQIFSKILEQNDH